METIYALWRGVGVLCETLLLTYLLWKKLPPAHNRRSRLILCVAGMLSLCVSNTTNGLVSESALHGGLCLRGDPDLLRNIRARLGGICQHQGFIAFSYRYM